jgi:hypothetical protein
MTRVRSPKLSPGVDRPRPATVATAEDWWFPGRWVGGASLILGPLTLFVGMALRLPFDFFFPQQLAAFHEHPTRMAAGYAVVAAGHVLLFPAVATLARLIGATRPGLAVWGGMLTILGLFARTFHAGASHMAFEIERADGVAAATRLVGMSYGAFHVFHVLSPAIMFGWLVLAVGAYRSRTLGFVPSVALGLMSCLMMGVLKGTSSVSMLVTGALCIALVPLGVRVLRDGPTPAARDVARWTAIVIVVAVGFYFLGEAG